MKSAVLRFLHMPRKNNEVARMRGVIPAPRCLAFSSVVIASMLAMGVAQASEAADQARLHVFPGWLFPATHLPANAKGLLFQDREAHTARDFSIKKGNARINVPVQLTPIRAFDTIGSNVIETVGKNRMMLFRVEPVGGFEPGQTYWFGSSLRGGSEFPVIIDRMTVDLRQIKLVTVGQPNLESTRYDIGCPSPFLGQVVAQAIQFRLPVEWRHYGISIRALTRRVSGANWVYEENLSHYIVSLDTFEGASVWDEHALFSCPGALTAKTQLSQISGLLAFPEVDDRWIETSVVDIPVSKQNITELDSLALLEKASAAGDPTSMLTALEHIPLRSTDDWRRFPTWDVIGKIYVLPQWWGKRRALQRREKLMIQLAALVKHKDSVVRAGAVAALARLENVPLKK